jgi:hypothetical protein
LIDHRADSIHLISYEIRVGDRFRSGVGCGKCE